MRFIIQRDFQFILIFYPKYAIISKTAVSEKFILAEGVTQSSITAITEAPALFAGFQVDDTHRSIRLLAGIDNLYYDSIGYEISLYSDDVLQNTVTKTINTVFSSVLDEREPVTAEELGFNYLALATITNIDRTNFPKDAEVYFKIKPFSTIGDEKLYGIEKRITVTYDYTRQENNFVYGVDAEFVPVLRFIATSDIHFKGAAEGDSVGDGAPRLKKILSQMSTLLLDETKNDGYTGLDAVVLAGDIANNGTKYQLDLAKNYLDEIIPEGTELVITTGNHDWLEWETLTPEGTLKQFEDVFGEATKDTVINGYHFITIAGDSAPADMDTWRGYGWEYSAESLAKAEALIQAAIEDTGADKPIFVIQHIGNADTVAGSNNMTPRYTLKEMESKYPNLVVFSGHSHFTINDECSIHQENFTAVGTGTVQDSQIHLVEVDEYGRVRLRKYSGSKEDFLGETWFIDSFDPRDFKYTADRFTEDDLFFAEDAEIIPEYIGADNISFQFLPVPEESLTARGYRIVLKDASGAVISSKIVERSYKTEDFTTPVKHSFAALTSDTQYTIEVTALNPMYETEYDLEGMFESEPLVLNFKTAKQSDVSGGDLISLYINATTSSATNTASSGLTAVTKGTPMFSHDKTIGMDVVSFDGSNTQAIMHDFYSVAEQVKDGFTVEAYFKIDEAPTSTVVAFGALQSAAFGFQINANGTMNFIIHDNTDYVKVYAAENYVVGKYYHVVAVYDGEKAHLYVDGNLANSADMADFKLHSTTTWHKLLIGADNNQNAGIQTPSKTTFAKFNLYSNVLSADEIASAYETLPKQKGGDLLNLFINSASSNASNSAKSELTTTIKGTPTFSHDDTIDMDVVSFDGTTSHYISNNFYPVAEQIKDGFAIEAYFRIDEAPTAKDSVAFGALQSAAFGLAVNVSGKLTFSIHNGSTYVKVPTTTTYAVGEYYHVVLTYDQSNAKIYVNGELEGSKEITNLKLHSKEGNYKLLLGADHDQDNVVQNPTKTTFALFNMYSEPLSADEVADAYTALS